MKIIHLSAECYPIAKVGGLADVVGALPKYQNNSDISSQVIMPFYDIKFTKENTFSSIFESELNLGENAYKYRILTLKNKSLDSILLFVIIFLYSQISSLFLTIILFFL